MSCLVDGGCVGSEALLIAEEASALGTLDLPGGQCFGALRRSQRLRTLTRRPSRTALKVIPIGHVPGDGCLDIDLGHGDATEEPRLHDEHRLTALAH